MRKNKLWRFLPVALTATLLWSAAWVHAADEIVHDAEYYILEAQNGEKWAADDKIVDEKLAAFREKNDGKPPNILYILIDDIGFGDLGSDTLNSIRGYKTPSINKLAREGMRLSRMYTEPSCTPTRVAFMTGRQPYRNGMGNTAVDISGFGLADKEVTLAEVLSDSGYSTVHIGKWHMGDIREAWPNFQGFDYAAFPIHQQGQLTIFHDDAADEEVSIGIGDNNYDDRYTIDGWLRTDASSMVTGVEGTRGKNVREVHMKVGERWNEAKYHEMNVRYQEQAKEQLRKLAKQDKPFFLQYWPLYPLTGPRTAYDEYTTPNGGTYVEKMKLVDQWIGELMTEMTAQATVNITVNPINNDPVANNDAFATDEDTPYTATLGVNDLLLNDADLDGDTLTVNTTPVSGPSNGTLVLNADGTFTYTPNANFNGSDAFVYEVSDGNGGTAQATVNITVNPINDAPVANDDAFATDEDTPYSATLGVDDLLLNDTDLDGDTLTVNTTPVSGPSNGTLVLNADGTFMYTANANFNGSDAFVYEVSDGNGGTAQATVNITVNPLNDDPVANDDSFATVENTPYTATLGVNDLLLNDTDLDGDTLTVNTTPVSGPSNGTLMLIADGTFTYTPNANFNGSDAFVYEVSDGNGGTAQATVNITVNPINDAPVANNDAFATDEDTPYTATLGVNDLLLNDTDLDGDTLTINTTPVSGPNNGTLVLNADGTFTYTANANFNGVDSFVYEVSDGNGGTAQATVNITVNPINDAPVANDDAFATDEDTPYSATLGVDDLLLNDTDLDGDTLTVNTTPVSGPSNGTLVLNADGTFTYTPNANFNGSDAFDYEVSDGNGGTAQATVNIAIIAVNDNPLAATDNYTVGEGETLEISTSDGVLANDVDADGDPLAVSIVDAPSSGTLTLNGDGSFSYTQDGSNTPTDGFTYQIDDGNGGIGIATVNITVDILNSVPNSQPDELVGLFGQSFNANVLSNDVDADLDTLTASLVDGPNHGTLTLNSDGSFTYMPSEGFVGFDRFTYVATDGIAESLITEVDLTVAFPATSGGESGVGNDPPISSPPGGDTTADENDDDLVMPVLITSLAEGGSSTTDTDFTASTHHHRPFDGPSNVTEVDLSRIAPPVSDGYASYYGATVASIDTLAHVVRNSTELATDSVKPALATWLWEQMAGVAEQLERDIETATLGKVILQASATAFGVGYVVWSVRSGYLLASMLSSLPAWRRFDPLPILDFAAARKREKVPMTSKGTLVENIIGEQIATGE